MADNIGFIEDEDDLGFVEESEEDGALSKFLDFIESYTGAPTRAGVTAYAKGENPLAAFGKQFGADPQTAPTPEEMNISLGMSGEPIELPGYPGQETPVKISPAQMAALPAAMLTDWTNLIPLLGQAKGLTKLGQAGAIGKGASRASRTSEGLQVARKSIPEIEAAAKNLDVPVFEGQLYKDPFTQAAEGVLQTSPAFVGRARQKKYTDAIDKIKEMLAEIAPKADQSKFEVGTSVKGALEELVGAEKEPLSRIYDTIAESTKNIPLSQRSTKAISRNVSKMPEGKFSISPAKQMIERAAQDIQKLNTVDEVKRYKTLLNQSLSPTASAAEKGTTAQISRKLKALEESTVMRAAEVFSKEAKDPKVKDLISSLITERKSVDAQYREFMGSLDQLSKGLGKGRVRSSDDAISFLEKLDSEKIADRLFQKNNVQFMKFFSNKYPNQAKEIFDYQKGNIFAKSMGEGGEISIKKMVKNVNSLPKEVKGMMFTAEELKKIADTEKYINSLPPHFNPSKTAIAQEYIAFFGNPFKAAPLNARDTALTMFLKARGKMNYDDAWKAVKATEKPAKGAVVVSRVRSAFEDRKLKNKRIKALE